MLGAVRHRGPDQFGTYLHRGRRRAVGLGSARLSIIDLGGGQQPISNEDSTKWIVFNGEIFNYIELRRELEDAGHRFATDSDTEVILHLYEDHGADCTTQLNGQFAFAIWDEAKEELFLARDRCGIRPLYYLRASDALIFGSEIKALLAHPEVVAALDPIGLDQIFTYWSPLSPRTAFEGIRTLPPGHCLRYTRRGEVGLERYWRLEFPRAGSESISDLDSAGRQLRELLVDSTRLRLRADVPVGAYLSGGLDSSAITSLVRRAGNRLETFSVAFTDGAFDESAYQRQMASFLGTEHHVVTCGHADIGEAFPDAIWHTETPVTRTSPVPLFLLSRLVREHGLKVVLTGEGADEFLAGYNLFKEAKVRRFWSRFPDSAWRPLLLRRLYPYIGDLHDQSEAYLRRFFGQGLSATASPTYSHELRWRNASRSKRLFSPALRQALGDADRRGELEPDLELPPDFDRLSPLARAQYLEATIFMPEYLLSSQGDRMAMAHSIEGRFPFLDHRVIAFCNRLKPRLKLCGLNEKFVLKHAFRDLLPDNIRQRRKQPYRAPIHKSFFPDGEPLPWVAEELAPARIEEAGCFDPRAVGLLVRKIGRFGVLSESEDMALAGVLSTQIVQRRFIAERPPAAALGPDDDVKVVVRGAQEEGR